MAPSDAPPLGETAYYQQYNQALIRKLEDKMFELEQDIAERIRVEADLKRLTTAIDHTSESVMVTGPDGTIQYMNPAFETLTGYTREEALGQNPRVLRSGRQDIAFYQDFWQTIVSGMTWTGHMVNRRKDGQFYTEDSTISPVIDANGTTINYAAIQRDVTEYLLLTQQLHRMQPSDPFYNDTKEMVDSVERCTNLIRQLLAFSRKQQIEVTTLNLDNVVANMARMLSRLIGEDVKLMTNLDMRACLTRRCGADRTDHRQSGGERP